MSREAQHWAAARTELDPKVRWTLWHLANYAHPDGRHAFPAVGTLADLVGTSGRTIQRHLRDLETLRYIEPGDQTIVAALSPGTPGNRRPFVWNLRMNPGQANGPRPDYGPGLFDETDPAPVDNPPSRGDTPVTPAPVDNSVRGDKTGHLGVTPVVTQSNNQVELHARVRARKALAVDNSAPCVPECDDPAIGSGRGWLADDPDTGLPRPCPVCRRHHRRVRLTA